MSAEGGVRPTAARITSKQPLSLAALLLAVVLPAAVGRAFAEDADAPNGDFEERSVWELGAGAFGVYAPDYPAADEYSLNGLPVPFVIYRGDFLRVGEEDGVELVPVDAPRYKLGISLGAAFPADSEDNELREGLPDLDLLLEAGPELTVHLDRFDFDAGGKGRLDAALAVRAAFSTDFSTLDYRGIIVEPGLEYRHEGLFGRPLDVFAAITPTFATGRLHDFFYEVDAQFARPGRPAFDADGGYLGSEVTLGLVYEPSKRWTFFAGTQIGIYEAAANEASPLFRRCLNAGVALGFAYTFYRSERTVRRRR